MAQFASTDDFGDLLGESLTGTRLLQAVSALEIASAAIQNRTGQTIERVDDDTIVLAGTDDWRLTLPQRPVVEATVATIDGVAPLAGSYQLIDDTLLRVGGWRGPSMASANWPDWSGYRLAVPSVIEVTYTHGFDQIPDDIRAVCLQMAVRVMQNPAGVRQESIGTYSVSYGGDIGGSAMSPAEEKMLGRYRLRAGSVKLR